MKAKLLLSTLVLACSHVSSEALAPPVVDLGYAKYQGVFNSTTGRTQFQGIRYAAPPVGPLRWRAPQPPALNVTIQKAELEPPTCYFAGHGNAASSPFRNQLQKRDPFFPSEDCLFLNVYTPNMRKSSARKLLPVVVWIHGGGYMSGSASGFNGKDAYNGNDLLNESNDGVVVVVIQYRLGVFGFLAGSKVKENGDLNAGILDQQFALRWVQKHIGQFGGDSQKVTIWGQSAGAGSVIQHLIANGGKTNPPLFRAAITFSSFLPSQYPYNDRIPEILYNEIANGTNCSGSSDTLNCLRQADANLLEQANADVGASGFFGVFLFVPVVDGTLIQQRPTEALKQHKVNGEIVMANTNTDEGALFIDPKLPADVDVTNYVLQLFPKFGQAEAEAAAAQYKGLGSPISQVTAIMGEAIFICPTYYLLDAFDGKGYKSHWAVPPAGHGDDLGEYWTSTNTNGVLPFNNAAFQKAFSQSFLDFTINQNTNTKISPTITPSWLEWVGQNEMIFNRTSAGTPDIRSSKTDTTLLNRCNFWQSVGALSAQ